MSNKVSIADALIDNFNNDNGILSEYQVGKEMYSQWQTLKNDTYKLCSSLYSHGLNNYLSCENLRRAPESMELYAKIKQYCELIGHQPFYVKYDDFLISMISYTTHSKTKFEDNVKYNNRELWMYRVERYLGYHLVLESVLPQKLIETQKNDNVLINRYKQSYRKRRKKDLNSTSNSESVSIKKEKEQNSQLKVPKEESFTLLTFKDIIIRDITPEHSSHQTSLRDVIIQVVKSYGKIVEKRIKLKYCEQCNVYLISQFAFENLREEGVILSRIVSPNQVTLAGGKSYIANLKNESMLKCCGYTVSATVGLTPAQRQMILSLVIKCNLYTKQELIRFLRWLIDQNHHVKHKDMTSALSKWKSDIEYLNSLDKYVIK